MNTANQCINLCYTRMPFMPHRTTAAGLLLEGALVRGLEPLHGVLLRKTMRRTDAANLVFSATHALATTAQHDVEVKTVDACTAATVVSTARRGMATGASIVPAAGSYLMPKSMCSSMPKPKLPASCTQSPSARRRQHLPHHDNASTRKCAEDERKRRSTADGRYKIILKSASVSGDIATAARTHDSGEHAPVVLKLLRSSSNSFTRRPRSRMSSAFLPRTVTCTAIASLRRIEN